MSFENNLHKKMVKFILGGVAPIEENPAQELATHEIRKSRRPSFKRIQSFFADGVEELRRDLNKASDKKNKKSESKQG